MIYWKRLPLNLSLGLVTLLAFATAAPTRADSDNPRSMTGVWLTKPASPFVLQDPDGPVKEFTLMRWELDEDEDGLITGYNTYYSQDDQGGNESRGTLCMVGAHLGSRVILSEAYATLDGEPVPELSTTPIFVFDCKQSGRKKIRCIGNGLSNIQPTALQAVLVRSKQLGDVIPVPEAAREICQPGS